jgi:hypothetical protein
VVTPRSTSEEFLERIIWGYSMQITDLRGGAHASVSARVSVGVPSSNAGRRLVNALAVAITACPTLWASIRAPLAIQATRRL